MVTLDQITAEQVKLYSYIPLPVVNIPISVEPLLLDELLPTEDEIEWAVKRLRNHRSRGPSGMQDEHLKGWLAVERMKEKYEALEGEETTEGNNRGGGESTEPTSNCILKPPHSTMKLGTR